jgi:Rieske Fe-S protein
MAAIGLAPASAHAMPLRWISALASTSKEKTYPIPAADGVQIDKENEVILSRVGKQVYAFALACPHQNTALRWEADDNRFQCPKHKSRYRPDGTFIEGRATRSMDRYPVKLAGNQIVVDIDKVLQEDMEKPAWLQAVVTLP